MMEISVSLPNEAATKRLGAALAKRLKTGDVVALSGPLGAGKTTLARSAIAELTGRIEAPSPTFSLVEVYETAAFPLFHFDLYRLEKADDVWELGLEDALDGVCLIEWPERVKGLLPPETLLVRLSESLGSVDAGARRALIRGDDVWASRLAGLNPA